ncbi:MAG TPA: SDR family NAD(P)-dependent oxidoreductase [Jatrophihabitantaceae bacterium]|nr:SDR family NAD(P)-dependent oxidoreductase [Jatrophihabitantaceae bacterium]
MQTAVITGAGGGLGAATARLFAERGWRVFAADIRTPEASAAILPITVDVTDADSVEAAAKTIAGESPDGVQAVVNFAGIMFVGALVELDEADLRRILDINVLGTYRVNKALFPLVRDGHGRIVNISSEVGRQRALMLNGPYAMSKHAVEAYSDALRRELMFVDVPVVTIQPGPFRTDMVGGIRAAFDRAASSSTSFERIIRKVGAMAAAEERKAHDPRLLAEVVWQAATSPKPKTHYSVRPDRRRAMMDRLPARVVDAALKRGLSGRR